MKVVGRFDGIGKTQYRIVLLVDRVVGGKPAVTEEPEPGAVKLVRARLCDHVDDGPARVSQFGGVSVRIHLKLLDSVLAELIRSASRTGASGGLSEESVVVIRAVNGQRVQSA